jgi:type IV pilus assembly protein PilE
MFFPLVGARAVTSNSSPRVSLQRGARPVRRGFTLIELMVVIVVIGILAAVGYPAYGNYVTRGQIVEAHSTLQEARVKMEQYFLDNRTYVGACTAGTIAPLPTSQRFTYACSSLAATTYTITATGNASTGVTGFTFTLDQSNARATTAVKSGWTANASCWVVREDGSC